MATEEDSVPEGAFQLVPVQMGGELRIRDLGLAARLGFERPLKIRELIKRWMADLERMGPCPAMGRVINGGEATEFYLNRKQAIFITAKSETAEATEITIEIIERFEAYECGQAVDPIAVLNDPEALRGLLLNYTEHARALKAQLADAAPKAAALDRIASADGSHCITDAAKLLQIRPKDLFAYLQQQGWIYRRPGSDHWCAYQARIVTGDLEHKVVTVLRADGTEKTTEQVRVTAKGLAKLAKLFTGPARLLGEGEAA